MARPSAVLMLTYQVLRSDGCYFCGDNWPAQYVYTPSIDYCDKVDWLRTKVNACAKCYGRIYNSERALKMANLPAMTLEAKKALVLGIVGKSQRIEMSRAFNGIAIAFGNLYIPVDIYRIEGSEDFYTQTKRYTLEDVIRRQGAWALVRSGAEATTIKHHCQLVGVDYEDL